MRNRKVGHLFALSRTARSLQLEAVRNLESEPAFPEQPPVVTVQNIATVVSFYDQRDSVSPFVRPVGLNRFARLALQANA